MGLESGLGLGLGSGLGSGLGLVELVDDPSALLRQLHQMALQLVDVVLDGTHAAHWRAPLLLLAP